MGEAKMRGEFSKRQAEAIARDKERQQRNQANRHKPMQKKITALAVMIAMANASNY